MKKFFGLFLIFTSYASADCSIHFFKNTVYTGDKKNLKISEVIEKTDCSKDLSSKLHQFVIGSAGTLKSKYLKGIDPTINYYPDHFHLTSLEEILREKMGLSINQEFIKLKFMNNKQALNLKEDQLLAISSEFKTGKMAFTLEIIERGGKSSNIWVEAVGAKYLEVFIATSDISPTSDLSPNLFKQIKKIVSNPNAYFLDEKTLTYHRLNRALGEGQILKKSHLIKKNLVTFGSPTKISYKSGNLIIKGMGIPLQSGKLGDLVKLKNPKNKKLIYGEVTGPNSVLVGI